MRRSDREITDPARIAGIISRCACCRVGFCDDGEVYIVPLNFGYETKDGAYVFSYNGSLHRFHLPFLILVLKPELAAAVGLFLLSQRSGGQSHRPEQHGSDGRFSGAEPLL